MQAIVTGKEMKAIDTYTIQQMGIPSLVLMERAAWAMINRMIPNITKNTMILSVCGAGNNGGDAVAVARILYGMGYNTAIYMAGPFEKWTNETKKQMEIARNLGVPEYNELNLEGVEVVVDGLFGIGLSSPVKEPYDGVIHSLNQWKEIHPCRRIWSVDMPSGVSSETGQVFGEAVLADYTVTFGYNKCGLVLYPGRDFARTCYVEDIGFPKQVLSKISVNGFCMETSDLENLPSRKMDSNKGDYGKVLVIAGSKNMSGAAYFAARSAYLMGVGLVRILTEEANRQILQTQLPQAMISVWEEQGDTSIIEMLNWATAVVIGPGIGTDDTMRRQIEQILPQIHCPLVIDADGLNLLAQNKQWYDKIKEQTIVTPHMGEMSRLTGYTLTQLKTDRGYHAYSYARDHAFICVLKDSSSVISNGQQNCYQHTGNDGMATGGSGDVLAGIIGGLAGMGCEPFMSACLGSYIHGCAGDHASQIYGTRSMTSVEIMESIVSVLKKY